MPTGAHARGQASGTSARRRQRARRETVVPIPERRRWAEGSHPTDFIASQRSKAFGSWIPGLHAQRQPSRALGCFLKSEAVRAPATIETLSDLGMHLPDAEVGDGSCDD